MILRSLHLENYKQYGRLDLEFRDGLVGIIGRNGSGKSTLFEAVLYCLYGKDESNKNLIRSAFADPKASVVLALQFAVGAAEYAVKREFRGKAMAVNAELFKNEQLIAKGTAQVNEEIAGVLNMERDAFKRSVFSGQKELSELSDTNGEARKKMVRKMLGLDNLDEVQLRINSDGREIGSQVAGQRQNLLDPAVQQTIEADLKSQTKSYKTNQTSLKAEQQKLRRVETDYQSAKKQFEAAEQRQKQHQYLEQDISRLQERRDGLQEQLENLQTKIRDIERQQEQLEAQKGAFSAYEGDKKRLQQMESDRQRYLNREANQAQLAELEAPIRHSKARLVELSRDLDLRMQTEQTLQEQQALINALELEMEQKREAFNQVKSQSDALIARANERRSKLENLKSIGREGTCPTCFQPVLDAYDQVVAQLNQEMEILQGAEMAALEQQKKAIAQEGQQLRNRLEEARKAVEAMVAEHSRLQELARQKSHEEHLLKNYEAQATRIQVVLREIGAVSFDEQAYKSLKARLEATEPLYLKFSGERAYVAKELPAARTALQQTEKSIGEVTVQLRERLSERTQTGHDPAQYETVKLALTQYGDAFSKQALTVRTLEKAGMELQNNIAQLQEKLLANTRIQEQVSAKLQEMDLLKKLGEMLLQFKTEILEKVSPSISREASYLFSRITRGKYERIEVDENFDFFIGDGGILYPIERFSGGEIDLANFCLRIAVTKAIMDLSGSAQGVEFLAFDEIFGSQDEERRHEMMLALYYLQEQFRQIYIISHIDSQKDYFPNLLEVTYHPEGSSVKWV